MKREWINHEGEHILTDSDEMLARLWTLLDDYLSFEAIGDVLRAADQAYRESGSGTVVES